MFRRFMSSTRACFSRIFSINFVSKRVFPEFYWANDSHYICIFLCDVFKQLQLFGPVEKVVRVRWFMTCTLSELQPRKKPLRDTKVPDTQHIFTLTYSNFKQKYHKNFKNEWVSPYCIFKITGYRLQYSRLLLRGPIMQIFVIHWKSFPAEPFQTTFGIERYGLYIWLPLVIEWYRLFNKKHITCIMN